MLGFNGDLKFYFRWLLQKSQNGYLHISWIQSYIICPI